jgi:hypothetical protein
MPGATAEMSPQPGPKPDQRLPIAKVLPDFGIHPLLPNWTPVEAMVLIKCLDDEGEPRWAYRTTAKANMEELLGALMVQVDLLRRELLESWWDGDEE